MTTLVKIDGEALGVPEFLRTLRLSGQYDGLIEEIVRDRLTVLAAKRQGIRLNEQEIQERADQFRRVRRLHRAADTNRYLDAIHVTLDEFEAFITDSLYREKMLERVCSDQAAESYFKLNLPKFESIEVSQIVLDSEGKAKEMVSVLTDDPDSFEEMAREHSIADTREAGGHIGKVMRGALRTEVEAKVFNAAVGDLLGPFASPDRTVFEIFRVNARRAGTFDEATRTEVKRILREEWLRARVQEHKIEAG